MGFFSGLGNSNPFTAAVEGEYNYNKQMASRAEKDAQFQAQQRRREGQQLLKSQIAAYGSSGVELQGSATEVMKRDQIDAEMEAMNIIYSGKMKSAEMKYKAKAQRNGAYLGMAKDILSFGASNFISKGPGLGSSSAGAGSYAANWSPGSSSGEMYS